MRPDPTEQAVQLAREGRLFDAAVRLRGIVEANPRNIAAWKWLAYSTSDIREALHAAHTVLHLDPSDEWARQSLLYYQEQARAAGLSRTPPAERIVIRPKPARKSANGSCLLQFMIVIALVSAFALIGVTANRIDLSGLRQVIVSTLVPPSPTAAARAIVLTSTPTVEFSREAILPPQVEETSAVEYYPVRAGDEASIQKILYNGGPQIDGAGEHSIALTQYKLWVTWEMGQSLSTCEVRDVVVHLDIKYIYPKWEPPVTPPDAKLQSEWDRFFSHVVQHEEHHAQIARECAGTLAQTLETFDAGATCANAQSTLDQVVDGIYAACEQRQKDFDAAEGRTSFPLP
jgi:predicted secreted Zn-dependent protease